MALFSGVIRSSVLNIDTGLTVVLPYDRPADNQQKPCKTMYLLHGLGGNHTSWCRDSNAERYARKHGVALIIPEVQKSFYTDMLYGLKYFKYLTQELPKLCSEMFNISSKREDTYIAGMSMGGYGALKCALTYPEQYAGCGAFSSVTDISYLRTRAAEVEELGNELFALFGETSDIPDSDDILGLAKRALASHSDNLPEFYITCGEQDYLYDYNKDFVKQLDDISFPHTFEEWTGEHDWDFWDVAIRKALSVFLADGN